MYHSPPGWRLLLTILGIHSRLMPPSMACTPSFDLCRLPAALLQLQEPKCPLRGSALQPYHCLCSSLLGEFPSESSHFPSGDCGELSCHFPSGEWRGATQTRPLLWVPTQGTLWITVTLPLRLHVSGPLPHGHSTLLSLSSLTGHSSELLSYWLPYSQPP